MTQAQVADIRKHAGDGYGPATIIALCDEIERFRLALRVIATLPTPEQDNMLSANMRKVAAEAI